jgi:16S rRNA (cytosine1402-N4)-methyltransferase
MRHLTVLKTEAIDALALARGDIVVDATFGAGGHAALIAERLGPRGTLIGIDADPTAIATGKKLMANARPTAHLRCDNFAHIRDILSSLHIKSVNGVLADLGWRAEQLIAGGRGFSFLADEPLLMTYGESKTYPFTAADIVNEWKEGDIANVIYGYGEERRARRIARAICKARQKSPIRSAKELADIIIAAAPPRHSRLHPATKTFQALRIAVNDELSVLERFINEAYAALAPGGRLAIITFHSLEDRIVKQSFLSLTAKGASLLTKRPVTPSEAETKENPRARSAKLRIIKRPIIAN